MTRHCAVCRKLWQVSKHVTAQTYICPDCSKLSRRKQRKWTKKLCPLGSLQTDQAQNKNNQLKYNTKENSLQ